MNPLVLHIEAATHAALVESAAKTLGVYFTAVPTALPPAAPKSADPAPATLPAPEPRAPRKPRSTPAPTPPSAAPAAVPPAAAVPAQAPSGAPANDAPAATSFPDVEQVRKALHLVKDKGGDEAVQAMLAKYGAVRVSAVPEDKRVAFIAECSGEAPSSTAAVSSADEVRYALSEVNGALGMAACTELLKSVGADRPSAVPEAKRAEFIAACKAKLPAKPA